MKDTDKIRNQANDYYNKPIQRITSEGDELPYFLEHITTEKLYKEFIEDTSDDYYLRLMKLYRKDGEKNSNDSRTTSRNLPDNQLEE